MTALYPRPDWSTRYLLNLRCWSVGFGLAWNTGTTHQFHLAWAIAAVSILAFAIVTYLRSHE